MKDVVIIGAGPGGFDTAIYAKEQGLDVVLIERDAVGGTCLNWGCIPTKALYHNALAIRSLSELSTFGIDIDNHKVDYDTIKKRKEDIVTNQIGNIHTSLQRLGIELIKGEATIKDPHTVVVNDQVIATKHIILATGSSPRTFPFPGSDLPIVNDSKGLLSLATWPKQMIVVGAGVIGSEMATIFQQFGANVTLVEYMPTILPSLDKDIQRRARNLYKRQGITVHTGASISRLQENNGTYTATIKTSKKDIEIETDFVLLATGRKPNFGNIPLEELGLSHRPQGIIVNEHKQTSIPNIYAIGDVNGELMLAHKATYDGYQAIAHILGNHRNIRFDLVPSVVFSTPEIAMVGKTEQELDKDTYMTSKYLYKTNAKAECMNETDGFIKMIIDHNGRIIGCHIIGSHASDLIHEVTGLMNKDVSVRSYQDIIHAHPTLSEIIGECVKSFH